MRPSTIFSLLCLLFVLVYGMSKTIVQALYNSPQKDAMLTAVVTGLYLTDPCISTEARYTRHPAVSDRMVAFMDHPGAIEHFPTGSFWTPPHKWQ